MPEFIPVATTSEVPVGRMKAVTAGERTVVLYHTASGFYASDNVCPHRGGPLAQGDLIGNEIVCPWHLWGFDVTTGHCPGNPEVSISTHEVRVDGDQVMVRLS